MKTTLCEGKHLRLVNHDGWEYAERTRVSGIVAILAVTEDRKLILIEQHRMPVGTRVIELPAGLAGDSADAENEELVAAARRELREETGYDAQEFELLFQGPPTAGATSEVITFFRALRLRRVDEGGVDGSEDIQVHEVPLSGAHQWLQQRNQNGTLVDPKVYAGLYFASCA